MEKKRRWKEEVQIVEQSKTVQSDLEGLRLGNMAIQHSKRGKTGQSGNPAQEGQVTQAWSTEAWRLNSGAWK